MTNMKEKIIKILSELRPEFDFNQDINYIEEGMLDSFDIVNLVNELEESFNITIDGTEILPENFSSADAIMKLIERNTQS